MALTNKLTAIADAIRAKDGSTDLLTLDQMPTAIAAIETGGGGDLPEEAFIISGECRNRFSYNCWNWFVENYGKQVTTSNITNMSNMFAYSTELEEIPFEINISNTTTNGIEMAYAFQNCELVPKISLNIAEGTSIGAMTNMFSGCHNLKELNDMTFKCNSYRDMNYMFASCKSLEQLPYIYNAYPGGINSLFSSCLNLKFIPEDYFDTWNFERINSYTYGYSQSVFQNCRSLRAIPEKILNYLGNETVAKSTSYIFNRSAFEGCYNLDEITNFPVNQPEYTSNIFINTFGSCFRLKNFRFRTNEDGSVKTAQWKSQTIDLSGYIGFWNPMSTSSIGKDKSGITTDKIINGADPYEALKEDPDATPIMESYSRYNHDSAVNTINSLPDTSAYLATAGGTNTIKFRGAAGSSTDGGAINTLTEEEIAVATAKGWTVTLN